MNNVASAIRENQGISPPLRKQGWRELGVHTYIKILLIGGLFYNVFQKEIYGIVHRWVNDPSWSHGFLIPLFSLYFINQSKKEILNLRFVRDPLASFVYGRRPGPLLLGETRANYLGLLFLLLAFLVYVFNLVSPSGYTYGRRTSIILTLFAVVLFLGGWRLIKYTWLPICFLGFAVPLPQRYYVSMTMPMRLFAAQVATALLNLVSGLEATAHGVVNCSRCCDRRDLQRPTSGASTGCSRGL
ncbi:MAG: exosortase/archaeosortase family protein [Planctomycetota bacterium]